MCGVIGQQDVAASVEREDSRRACGYEDLQLFFRLLAARGFEDIEAGAKERGEGENQSRNTYGAAHGKGSKASLSPVQSAATSAICQRASRPPTISIGNR